MRNLSRGGALLALIMILSACSKGGQLVLEPNRRVVETVKGSGVVSVTQGGKALVVQTGQTAATGVHGWVSVQGISARNLSDGTNTMDVNKTIKDVSP